VLHNGLLKDNYEWVLIEQGRKQWHYGRTAWIQDLEGFSQRDYDKPSSDTRRGMLPPKLARTMVNLAGVAAGKHIYDPFVGSGVLLMEAKLLGYQISGSDISAKAVADTKQNLQWLNKIAGTKGNAQLAVADASGELPYRADAIVTEGYLGHPVRESTSFPEILEQQRLVDSLLRSFLRRAHAALPSGGRLVITVPLWRLPHSGDRRTTAIDGASELGYTVIRPVPQGTTGSELTERNSILVSRPKQRVVHELYVLERRG
jgi:tRNA G10  N-methylase Trm11